MIKGLWGTKIGMTQVFADKDVVPVTAINTAHWFIVGSKSMENDGYSALKVGRVRKRYEGQAFNPEWLKRPKHYFVNVREIRSDQEDLDIEIGQSLDLAALLQSGSLVDVFGKSRGRGFQGVVKRHGFSGGPKSHGSNFGRRPGSIGFFCTEGRVEKGKKLPGHMGAKNTAVRGLQVVQVHPESNLVLVKGAIPGSKGSVVFVRKQVDKA